jgi:hypothetical protein
MTPYSKASTWLKEAGYGIEIINFANRFKNLIELENGSSFQKIIAQKQKDVENFFKDYHQPIDREVFEILLTDYQNNSNIEHLPKFFNTINSKYSGDIGKFADYVFKKSVFTSKTKMLDILKNAKFGKLKILEKDPAYKLAKDLSELNNKQIKPNLRKLQEEIQTLQRMYMKAQMEMQPDKHFYPDANSTIRVTYGKVKGFEPRDGLIYKHYTTIDGIIEKEDPNVYDYVVEDKLKELYLNKDYGQYADKDGNMRVCFLAANHTSGGNSGSPLLNADGHLIGLNFDRCWESTMSDLMYDPNYCRNISVDIRFCLFIIDKFAGADHLIQEMTIIK